MANTSRLSLRYPVASDTADVPRDIGNLAADLDKAAIFSKGTFAARPTSTVGSPGIDGRYYFATDTSRLYLDTGTSWVEVASGDGSVTSAMIADGAIATADIADSAVTFAKGAAVPFCEIGRNENYSLGNASFETFNATTTATDNGVATTGTAMADLTNDRIYFRRAGLYSITGRIAFAANSAGNRRVDLVDNGTGVRSSSVQTGDGIFGNTVTVACVANMGNGDWVRLAIIQNSGGGLNVKGWFQVVYVGKTS